MQAKQKDLTHLETRHILRGAHRPVSTSPQIRCWTANWPPSKNINTCWCSYTSWPNLEVFGGKPKCIQYMHIILHEKNITYIIMLFFFRWSKTPGKTHGGWILCFIFPGVLSEASRLNPLELLVFQVRTAGSGFAPPKKEAGASEKKAATFQVRWMLAAGRAMLVNKWWIDGKTIHFTTLESHHILYSKLWNNKGIFQESPS